MTTFCLQSALVFAIWIFPLCIQAEQPPIRSASELKYPSFSIVREDNSADGFSVELMRAAIRAMGRDVTFEVGPWTTIKGDLEEGRLEALPLVGRTPEREPVFDFTVPYLSLYGAVFVRDDEHGIKTPEDLYVGIATFPEHAQSWQKLINAADKAMYAAKKEGRNQVQTAYIDDIAQRC
ncbi:MAG: transporter substrate-binding domain-containing protein [Candidatus Thiodiazotropha sp. (ex Dulcina madagascariensis)]|nr:transporter substrate-binding domain-containing protein [Candidatus Thiodiazotropha sp. (ex Dulcina madagascariensis)]